MLSRRACLTTTVLLIVLSWPRLQAQEFTVARADAAVIVLSDNRLAVLADSGGRILVRGVVEGSVPAGQALDIRIGDVVTSFQGNSRPVLDSIRAIYDALKIGEEVELGLKRGAAGEHRIRFPRPAAPPTGSHMAVIPQGGGAAGVGAWSTAGPSSNVDELVIAGVHIRSNDQGMPEVGYRTSDPAAMTVTLRAGDVILSVNGRPIAALAGLDLLYQKVQPGDSVTMTVRRAGRDFSIGFLKPDAR